LELPLQYGADLGHGKPPVQKSDPGVRRQGGRVENPPNKRANTRIKAALRILMPKSKKLRIRAADAKEVGVGNPAEETYRCPNQITGSTLTPPRSLSIGQTQKSARPARAGFAGVYA